MEKENGNPETTAVIGSGLLFSMTQNQRTPPTNYPSVPFGGYRMWDTICTWKDLETANGVYNWKNLDDWLAQAKETGHDVLYCFGKVPTWAGGGTGFNNPPSDLATGNNYFKAFVTALVQRSLASTTAKISFYELWNEPNLGTYWTGTPQQLLTMGRDAYTIIKNLDPSAIVFGPSGSGGTAIGSFILNYYSAAGSGSAIPQDGFAYHAYLQDGQRQPFNMSKILEDIKVKKNTWKISSQPTWFTEGSWGRSTDFHPLLSNDEQIAYMAQQYLYSWNGNGGVIRYYWYAWDNTNFGGQMYDPATQTVFPVGTAFGLLQNWVVGSTITKGLSQDTSGTWTINLTLASGEAGTIAWNNTAATFTTTFANVLSLDSTTPGNVTGGAVSVIPKPILLTTLPLPIPPPTHSYLVDGSESVLGVARISGSVDGIPVDVEMSLASIQHADTIGGLPEVQNLIAPKMLAAAYPPEPVPIPVLPPGTCFEQ